MVKGNQRRVIHLKNTDSGIFDEAYFILREGENSSLTEESMIKEANRIIEENSKSDEKKKRLWARISPLSFFTGMAIMAAALLPFIILALI